MNGVPRLRAGASSGGTGYDRLSVRQIRAGRTPAVLSAETSSGFRALNQFLAPAVGLIVFVLGLLLLRWHRKTRTRLQNDPSLDEHDQSHYARQYRRRMTTSSMVALLGVLIAVGDLLPWNRMPLLFPFYWGAVLLLALWVVLLALGDLASSRAYTNAALSRIRQKQLELELEAAEHRRRRRHQENGNCH